MTGILSDDTFVRRVQSELTLRGHDIGGIDGKAGEKTLAALTLALGPTPDAEPLVDRTPRPDLTPAQAQQAWPLQRDVSAFFGPAGGPDCTGGIVTLPFPLVLAWDLGTSIRSFRCHRKVAQPLAVIFAEAARHYGEARFRELRLDRFGGCYNFRPMRGGTSLSMHSWGIAVDLDPERNQLRWGADRAAFARPEYEPFWRIVEGQGATSLGRAADRDFRHFQFARLK